MNLYRLWYKRDGAERTISFAALNSEKAREWAARYARGLNVMPWRLRRERALQDQLKLT